MSKTACPTFRFFQYFNHFPANMFMPGNDHLANPLTVLDDSSSIRLPPISPDPLSGGTITLDLTAAEAPGFSPAMFLIDDVTAAVPG